MILSSTLCISLMVVRVIKSDTSALIFLVWNLFLAWIPYLLSLKIKHINSKPMLLLLGTVWLVFLPNAPYLFTDLLHLRQRIHIPLWYDVFLCSAFAWTGLLLGLASLQLIHKKVSGYTGTIISHFIIASIIFLCSYGLYLGRFLRRNSWDIITSPATIISDTLSLIIHPYQHLEVFYITLVVTAFTGICYLAIITISGTSNFENSNNKK
jgi:uncharacterized membrane protein